MVRLGVKSAEREKAHEKTVTEESNISAANGYDKFFSLEVLRAKQYTMAEGDPQSFEVVTKQ